MDMTEQTPEMADMPQPDQELFGRANDLALIQEYNEERNIPKDVIKDFWSIASKSILLGFWDKDDEQDLYFLRNNINVGHIMSKPKHKYTFKERQNMTQLRLLMYANFKRGVGMEKYKLNERTLQATTTSLSLQGAAGGQPGSKRGGVVAGLRNIFG